MEHGRLPHIAMFSSQYGVKKRAKREGRLSDGKIVPLQI